MHETPNSQLESQSNLNTKNSDYFTVETIRTDLQAFATQYGAPVEKFSTSTKCIKTKALCQSGEILTLNTYIRRAAKALFGLKSYEVIPIQSEITNRIKAHVGFIVPKEMTICNLSADVIKEDIQRFAKKCKKAVGELSRSDVNTRADCSNGDNVMLGTYCKRVGKLWDYGENFEEIIPHVNEILVVLQSIAGMEYEYLDEEYLTASNLKADLEGFAKVAGVNVKDFHTGHKRTRSKCQNGIEYTLHSYVNQAGDALGLINPDIKLRLQYQDILHKLCKMVGIEVEERIKYPKMKKPYFTSETIQKDFEEWAKIAQCDLEDLKVFNCYVKFVAQNGEEIYAATYLNRAAKAFKMGKNQKEYQKRRAEVIKFLKRIIGTDVEVFKPMDFDYFNDTETVRNDLKSFAINAKKPLNKLCYSHIMFVGSTCSNGEIINGQTYLHKAAKAFGYGKTNPEVNPHLSKTFNELKQIASQAA